MSRSLRLYFEDILNSCHKEIREHPKCVSLFFWHLAVATTLDMNEPQRTQRTQS